MRRILTMVNNQEFELIQKYCEKNKMSLYKLVKDSVFEKINKDLGKEVLKKDKPKPKKYWDLGFWEIN